MFFRQSAFQEEHDGDHDDTLVSSTKHDWPTAEPLTFHTVGKENAKQSDVDSWSTKVSRATFWQTGTDCNRLTDETASTELLLQPTQAQMWIKARHWS
jgi:hypothetical protein